jgi:hypothetical protein
MSLCLAWQMRQNPALLSIMRRHPLNTALPPSSRHILRKRQHLKHYDRSYLIETQKPAMEVFVLNLLQKVLVIDLTRSLIPASTQQRLPMHVKVRFNKCMPEGIRIHAYTQTHAYFRSTLRLPATIVMLCTLSTIEETSIDAHAAHPRTMVWNLSRTWQSESPRMIPTDVRQDLNS